MSGRGDSYKPKAKSSAVQRESEGVVVPTMVVQNNATGGRGPWGGHVGEEGKREGMDRESVPNSPGRRRPRDKVQRLRLELHPEKTRRVDLSWGRQGFDFLGCNLRKQLCGPIWEKERRRLYFLHRWPSQRSMKRVRQRVKERTGRNRNGVKDVRVIIRDINPVLRGWANYFRTGNAAVKFNQVDDYVQQRLRGFMVKRKGRNLRAGEASRWTHDFFHAHGLYRLRGTIKYPEAA